MAHEEMSSVEFEPPVVPVDEFEAYLDSLENSPTGDDLRLKDFFSLVSLGIILPAALIVWGWF